MGYREEQYTHIYDELVDKLGEGTWAVIVGGVRHFARIWSGGTPNIQVYINEKNDSHCSVMLKSKGISLSRDSTEYAKTILECLNTQKTVFPNARQIHHAASLQIMVKLEDKLGRALSPNLFKTIFKSIMQKGLEAKEFHFSFKEDSSGITLLNQEGNKTSPFFVVEKQETDQEIMGRFLCGLYLFEKQRPPELTLSQER